jgi:hypothetical protein
MKIEWSPDGATAILSRRKWWCPLLVEHAYVTYHRTEFDGGRHIDDEHFTYSTGERISGDLRLRLLATRHYTLFPPAPPAPSPWSRPSKLPRAELVGQGRRKSELENWMRAALDPRYARITRLLGHASRRTPAARGTLVLFTRAVALEAQRIAGATFQAHHGLCVGADETFHVLCLAATPRPVLHARPANDVAARYRSALAPDITRVARPALMRNSAIVDASTCFVGCPQSIAPDSSGTRRPRVRW